MAKTSAEVYKTIRELVLNGSFPPDYRLKETELVSICKCSRTPVREALKRLAAEDYIIITPNQGAQIKPQNEDDIEDMYQLRAILEGYSAAKAARLITKEQLAIIHDAISRMDTVLTTDQPVNAIMAEFLELNQLIHATIWEAARSERLKNMLARLIDQALILRTAKQFSLVRLAQSHHHHMELYSALKSGNEAWAESIMKSHIYTAKDDLLHSFSFKKD